MNKKEVVRNYWDKESEFDLPGVLEYYVDDATFSSPESTYQGKKEIEEFYKMMMTNNQSLKVTILHTVEQDDYIAVEYRCDLVRKDGESRMANGFNLFRIVDEKIMQLHCYYDPQKF